MADDQPGVLPGAQPNSTQPPTTPNSAPLDDEDALPPPPPPPPAPVIPTATPSAAPSGPDPIVEPAPAPAPPAIPAAIPSEPPVDQATLTGARDAVQSADDTAAVPASTEPATVPPAVTTTPQVETTTAPSTPTTEVSAKDIVEKDLFELLKLQDLPEEEKDKFRTEAMEIVRDRVLLRIQDGLSEEDRATFNTLLEGTPDDEKIQGFLKERAIDLNQLMLEETILYKTELVNGVGPMAAGA